MLRWDSVRLLASLVVVAACDKSERLRDADVRPPPLDQVGDTPGDEALADAPVLPACVAPVSGTTVIARKIGTALGDAALLVTAPPGDPRLFVVMRGGAIRILENNQVLPDPFVDLSDKLVSGGEQGLLGLAFHPAYHLNRQFFVYYTRQADPPDTVHRFRNVIARCTTSPDNSYLADPASCEEILAIRDPAANHNGGMIEFGSDGFLYIGTGDGGTANDPSSNAQTVVDGSPTARSVALLGKLLRIDVDHPSADKPYSIPPGNPFATGGGAPEILAIGFRNPWRWSFDAATGDLWFADVGQDAVEELDVAKASEIAGKNFGWSMWEGNDCAKPPCTTEQMSFPQRAHRHDGIAPDNFAAIVGGQVYRGTCYPDLVGTYFYTDHGAGGLHSAKLQADGSLVTTPLAGSFPGGVTSIHAAATGELYLTTLAGGVYHLEGRP